MLDSQAAAAIGGAVVTAIIGIFAVGVVIGGLVTAAVFWVF